MHSGKIVIGEVEAIRRFQICPLPAESVGESRHSAHAYPYRQIGSLNMRGTDSMLLGVPNLDLSYSLHNISRGVSLLSLSRGCVDLDELRKFNASAQAIRDGVNIGPETVRGQLKAACVAASSFSVKSIVS